MWSSEARRTLWVLVALASGAALAQPQAQGFAVDRFYPSPAGNGWFAMDALDTQPGFGGAMALTAGYAHDPLNLASGADRLAVVSDQAVLNFAAAVSYERWRLFIDLRSPLLISGQSGALGGYSFSAPAVTLGSNPDTLSDPQIGADVRIVGDPDGAFRAGASAELLISNGSRANYDTDGTPRAIFRALAAGDLGAYRYAAEVGVQVRPLDDAPIPGSPRGSELLFGAAAGRAFDLSPRWRLAVGPELFGETALRSFFQGGATGLEALLSARFEERGEGARIRVKAGAGVGLDPQFGTPQWRALLGIEYFNRGSQGK